MENRYGYCKCGCGHLTPIRKFQRGIFKKGEPVYFLTGHHQKTQKKLCSIEGCRYVVRARGLCNGHYLRKWKKGTLFDERPIIKGRQDLTGNVYNRWTVLGLSHINKSGTSMWKCLCTCGNERNVRSSALIHNKTISCGCYVKELRKSAIGEKSTNWKGGRREQNGYILLKKNGHPNSDNAGYIAEHRFVMSEYMGRKLEDYELVHHKNGIRNDNRLENLELLTYANHIGEIECPHCKKLFLIK